MGCSPRWTAETCGFLTAGRGRTLRQQTEPRRRIDATTRNESGRWGPSGQARPPPAHGPAFAGAPNRRTVCAPAGGLFILSQTGSATGATRHDLVSFQLEESAAVSATPGSAG